MIAQLWQHPVALLAAWAVLAAVWLWALPRENVRGLDRAYPLLPLVLALVLALLPAGSQPAWLASFMQLGLWLWLWLTVVWLISLLKRDASIMDIAYGFLLLCAPWWLFWHLGGEAQPSSVLLLALCRDCEGSFPSLGLAPGSCSADCFSSQEFITCAKWMLDRE